MRLNPFEFPKGLTLSEHISKLCQVFEGAFPIAPPAPFILDKAIEGIYRAHGWNTNDINTGEKEYPTMSELYDRFQKELSQTTYDSEIQGNIEEFSIQTSDNEIAYDYRFISWTVSEINSYMNLLTSEDKTLDLPMVVAEWNKKIPQKNIRWSTDAMQVYLDKYLHENFGDLYTTKIKNCGAVLSNEVEYEPSVYIEATDSAKYPWLSFVVTGEQLTMTQVSFAIYALYLPTKDSQCTQAVDTIEQNQKYQNRLITLKQAQNPKIKNYIESINEILISGLEAWLNNNNTSSMYD